MVKRPRQPPLYSENGPAGLGGFTFVGLLFALAIAGIALAGTGVLWAMESRREKEKELLFIGEQFRDAISSYYKNSPGNAKQFPEKIEDLLQDRRFPMAIRHLRRFYRDPMTSTGDWELIFLQGRIIGVSSKSQGVPIKIAGFSAEQDNFTHAKTYADWRFVSSGSNTSTQQHTADPQWISSQHPRDNRGGLQ